MWMCGTRCVHTHALSTCYARVAHVYVMLPILPTGGGCCSLMQGVACSSAYGGRLPQWFPLVDCAEG